ncbi:MAG: hypothetical protein NT169_28105 [Chloroflexi bacterium]|nr:hypothetical protein [Chloroflexota bacterium]
MSDPLHENCKRFAESGGKVTGVQLTHVPMPGKKYELLKTELIDEDAARGNIVATVIVKDKDGIDARVSCWLAWPWKGQLPASWEGRGLPGNTDVPYKHMITNAYNPATQPGPLAIYIGDAQGNIESDVIAGLGLPGGRHVSYFIVFRERTGEPVTPPVTPPVAPPVTPPSGDLAAQLQRIETKLDRLAQHFGLQG